MSSTAERTSDLLRQLATAHRQLLTRHAGLREHAQRGLTEGTLHRHPGSKPPADLTPLALVQSISAHATLTCRLLGKTHLAGMTVPGLLEWAAEQAHLLDEDTAERVHAHTARLLQQARDLLLDVDPAMRRRLREPCPYCQQLSLRYSFGRRTVRCTNRACRMQPEDVGPPVWTLMEFLPHLAARESRLNPPPEGTAA